MRTCVHAPRGAYSATWGTMISYRRKRHFDVHATIRHPQFALGRNLTPDGVAALGDLPDREWIGEYVG